MLSARPTNTMNAPAMADLKKDTSKTKLKNTTNTRKGGGLKVSDPNTIASTINKPKAAISLKSATNTHIDEPVKKKTTQLKPEKAKQATTKQKSDENDISEFIQQPYDPLSDVHPFDEELYQRVLKLELADDGLPSSHFDEPFDF